MGSPPGFVVSPVEQYQDMRNGTASPTEPTSTPRGAVQLRLLPGGTTRPDWVLDERTRKVGRQGVAQAREILRRVGAPRGRAPGQLVNRPISVGPSERGSSSP